VTVKTMRVSRTTSERPIRVDIDTVETDSRGCCGVVLDLDIPTAQALIKQLSVCVTYVPEAEL
jgi:hypothetical protein